MSNVKVAVRVRPFNDRERGMNPKLIIKMNGQGGTTIVNPDDGKEKPFQFDYSYWSHDGYVEPTYKEEYLKAKPGWRYDDQNKVFNDLGQEVLENAFLGYNACLFAYGQTGSGKSYSIVGFGENKGIIPRVCDELFSRIEQNQKQSDKKTQYSVVLSMIEIYNEKVQDLLVKPSERQKDGLQVREIPEKGVYVDGAKFVPVSSYKEIQIQIDQGTENRTIASTNMNQTSSRAHTVSQIIFKQKTFLPNGAPERELISSINLIDLAGSERQSATGTTGQQLVEGCNINKSLSVLGKVISVLAKTQGKTGPGLPVVPYRESKLTHMLKPFLGGNAKTSMIAALSPAAVNYEETFSTLRYANQVKEIKNLAKINESPQDKMIRELKEEIERLKMGSVSAGVSAEIQEKMQQQAYMMQQIEQEKKEFERQLKEQRQENERRAKLEAKIKQTPQIRNINQDPQMSGIFKYAFNNGDNVVGKKTGGFEPEIVLNGVGIAPQQCVFNYNEDDRRIILIPNAEDLKKYRVVVNGEVIQEPTDLMHGDRILIGSHHYFVYVDPQVDDSIDVEYEFAMKEANKEQMSMFEDNQEYKKKLKQMEDKLKEDQEAKAKELQLQMQKLEEEKQAYVEQLKQQQAEIKARGDKEMQLKLQQEKAAFEEQMQLQQQMLEEEKRKNKLELEKALKAQQNEQAKHLIFSQIDSKLQEIVPKITEMNTICRELGRQTVYYEPEILTEVKPDGTKNSKVVVRVYPNRNQKEESGLIPWETFTDKIYFDVKDLYEDAEDRGFSTAETDNENDGETFGWALTDQWHHLGNVYYFLLSVYNLIDTSKDVSPVLDTRGAVQGKLTYSMTYEALDVDGQTKLNLLDYENLSELLGKNLKIILEIKKATDVPEKYSFKTMCKYVWGDEQFETQTVSKNRNPDFNYRQEHIFQVNSDMLSYLLYNSMTLQVYGMIESKKKSIVSMSNVEKSEKTGLRTGDPTVDKRLRELERQVMLFQCRQNAELAQMLEQERIKNQQKPQAVCCIIF